MRAFSEWFTENARGTAGVLGIIAGAFTAGMAFNAFWVLPQQLTAHAQLPGHPTMLDSIGKVSRSVDALRTDVITASRETLCVIIAVELDAGGTMDQRAGRAAACVTDPVQRRLLLEQRPPR